MGRLALVAYGLAMVEEWVARGHADRTREQIAEFARPERAPEPGAVDTALLPPWWGREDVHRSHRAALLRKDPEHYADLDVDDPHAPYAWPDPPAPAPDPLPVSAWLVRADDAPARASLLELGIVVLPAAFRTAAATPKQRRQVAAFTDEMAPGDAVALTDGDLLEVGEVVGLAVPEPSGGLGRRVRFTDRLARGALRRPWQLQDPRALSRLRGEGNLRAAARVS